jgi:formiminotetrahydrofolate cyclodeaminase
MHDRITELPARELLERLSTREPVPGGGSAAALAGAMAAALVQMVVELTTDRPAAVDHEPELATVRTAAIDLRARLLRLTELDAAAYEAVVAARRLPRDTDPERAARTTRIEDATRDATRAPLETAGAAGEVLDLASRIAPIGNRNAISDVGVAALLAAAALRGAALNVRINLPYLPDGDPLRDEAAGELARLERGLDDRERAIREAVEARLE